MSIIAISSASCTGFSDSGSGLPRKTIFARLVTAARIAPNMLVRACMQNGALWCSFSMMPSTPHSSAMMYSSRYSLYSRLPATGS